MKRTICVCLILLMVLCSCSSQQSKNDYTSSYNNNEINNEVTVYVTDTGKCYHKINCRYLYRSSKPMELKDAARKYRACSVCKPPKLEK